VAAVIAGNDDHWLFKINFLARRCFQRKLDLYIGRPLINMVRISGLRRQEQKGQTHFLASSSLSYVQINAIKIVVQKYID
jgi:hypothetical protein